jgi:hypothetical protein
MLPSSRREADLEGIISVARARNALLGVTGALISSSYTFAQLLEGPAASVDALMVSIIRDSRHREVKVISVESEAQKRFPTWAMAFAGHAHYIDRHIEMLLDPSFYETDHVHVGQLQSLMEEFSKRLT